MQIISKYDLLKKITTAILGTDGFKTDTDQDLAIAKSVLKAMIPHVKFQEKGMTAREFVDWRKTKLEKARSQAAVATIEGTGEPEDTGDFDEYSDRLDKIEERVEAAIKATGKKSYIVFSAYTTDDNDNPIDNLDEIAHKGRVILFRDKDEYWGGEKSRAYQSPILTNPTWLECAVHANQSVLAIKDRHHVFFEGLYSSEDKHRDDDVVMLEIAMGS